MKKIKLTQGKYALVDDEDFDKLNLLKWSASKDKNTWYVRHSEHIKGTKNGCKTTRMTSYIVKVPLGKVVDHIDGNGLNNQRKNLRVCTPIENSWNKKRAKNNTSGYKGISFRKNRKTWLVRIMKNGEEVFNKNYKNKKEAILASNNALIKYYGEFAKLHENY